VASTSDSPFVDALNHLHVSAIATIFNWVVILASLSSVDGGLYTASRMMFAVAREGHFPAAVARTSPGRKVPTLAILITSLSIFVGAVVAYFYPTSAYVFVASLASFGFLSAWFMIPVSQILIRRQRGEAYVRALKWRVPLYPLTPLVAIVSVIVAMFGQFFYGSGNTFGPITIPGSGITVVVGIIWTLFWAGYYMLIGRKLAQGAAWQAQPAAAAHAYQVDTTGRR
jgi:L-asparagine transporter-like permease